jgi:hypothetical protein
LSDHLPALTEAGRDLIRKVLHSRLSQPAVPVDLFDSHEGLPSVWRAEERDHWLVGVFNWEEDAADIELDLASLGIIPSKSSRSFWDDRPVRVENGIIKVHLEPRESMGIRIDKEL